MQISEQLYLVRTKTEAAELLDVSRQTIHKWEKEGPVVFLSVEHEWLAHNMPDSAGIRRDIVQGSHAYVIGNVPRGIETRLRLNRFRGVFVSPNSLPGYQARPDRRYSIREAGIRLKLGYLGPGSAGKNQAGFSRSYMYGIMGDEPGQLRSIKDGGRRFITEQAVRDYEAANRLPPHKILVRIYEPDDSEHWEERIPDPSERKTYSSPRVLYFKPFG